MEGKGRGRKRKKFENNHLKRENKRMGEVEEIRKEIYNREKEKKRLKKKRKKRNRNKNTEKMN